MKTLFEIDGYHVILENIQNVYPVEKDKKNWIWGFKFKSQIFEFFYYETKKEAEKVHDAFITALELYSLMKMEK